MDESTQCEQADLEWLARYERLASEQPLDANDDDDDDEAMEVEEMWVDENCSDHDARLAESRQFCAKFYPLHQERQAPECLYERLVQERREFVQRTSGPQRAPQRTGAVTPVLRPPRVQLNHKKEIFYVKSDACVVELQFQFANFVTATYFGHALTGADYGFNSYALINALLPYYPEFRKKKFAKVNLRLRDCGSHMIYNSGIIVESGSDCMRKSREMLKHVVWLLRHVCGCRHLVVQRRACFNIVATGNLRALNRDGQMQAQSLCLGVLKELFPAASYKKDKFQGIIIKLVDVERYFADQAYYAGLSDDAPEYQYAEEYDSEDDDAEVIQQINGECDGGGGGEYGAGSASSVEAEAQRNATLEDEFAQLATKKDNGTFLIFKEGQITCTGCKSKRRLLEAYDKIYSLLVQCLPTPENLAREKTLGSK